MGFLRQKIAAGFMGKIADLCEERFSVLCEEARGCELVSTRNFDQELPSPESANRYICLLKLTGVT